MCEVRDVRDGDLGWMLELNQAAVPAVGSLDLDRLRWLVGHGAPALVAEIDAAEAGFVIALPPGVGYSSENYRWFRDRYEDFVYVDRIAVAPWAQGRGVGQRLYRAVEEAVDAPHFLCEVNLRPRNEGSLRFHERLGFRSLGEQDTEGGAKRVVLLEKALPQPSVG